MKRGVGEMWGSVLECGRSEGRCRGYGIFYPFFPTSLYISFTSPTSSFSSSHTSPHPNTFLHISCHTFSLLPYSLHTCTNSPNYQKFPNSSTIHTPPNCTPSFFPILHPPVLPIVTLSLTPQQNFSLFSVIVKLVQQS